ncbi:hypothetical protein RMCBS344292_10342 [Rhizopus microsporus]|nr:hypothetical protein RMCBS344292_10342 [Rhizopus microsporus]
MKFPSKAKDLESEIQKLIYGLLPLLDMNKGVKKKFMTEKQSMDSFLCQNEASEVINIGDFITDIIWDMEEEISNESEEEDDD